MPHCSKCGTAVASDTAFCPNCGAAQSASPGVPTSPAAAGLSENVAGLLCYLVGWITGLIFLLIDKRPFVRFHAAQSLVTFGALNILSIIVGMVFGMSMMFGGSFNWTTFGLGMGIRSIVDIASLIVWIVGMFKAYQHERFRIPIAADLADQIAGK
jgi:uncharacterized membrane protein